MIDFFDALYARFKGWSPECAVRGHKIKPDPTKNIRMGYRHCIRDGCSWEKYLIDQKEKMVGKQEI